LLRGYESKASLRMCLAFPEDITFSLIQRAEVFPLALVSWLRSTGTVWIALQGNSRCRIVSPRKYRCRIYCRLLLLYYTIREFPPCWRSGGATRRLKWIAIAVKNNRCLMYVYWIRSSVSMNTWMRFYSSSLFLKNRTLGAEVKSILVCTSLNLHTRARLNTFF